MVAEYRTRLIAGSYLLALTPGTELRKSGREAAETQHCRRLPTRF